MRSAAIIVFGVAFAGLAAVPATEPVTQPARDAAVDWLMDQATTAPASTQAADVPATQEVSPFREEKHVADAPRDGVITLSDGKVVAGAISTTAERPVRIWVEEDKEYQDLPFNLIRSFEAKVVWERDQPEWTFKESGSDIKQFSGKTYPAREVQYVVTLVNGQSITGGIVAPLYLHGGDGEQLYILHKRDKGTDGQTLEQLVYVKKVEFK